MRDAQDREFAQLTDELRERLVKDDLDPARVLASAVLLLVEVLDQVGDELVELNEHSAKTARCLDYFTDHLHEVGQS